MLEIFKKEIQSNNVDSNASIKEVQGVGFAHNPQYQSFPPSTFSMKNLAKAREDYKSANGTDKTREIMRNEFQNSAYCFLSSSRFTS